ncbi:hypothetical protein DENSPDRAFT_855601 [Dentipellis sp. KUC8613]|nr:hypothetical protein DENSPDRAFT_855601 [Dentipellis sp. KUC8613]
MFKLEISHVLVVRPRRSAGTNYIVQYAIDIQRAQDSTATPTTVNDSRPDTEEIDTANALGGPAVPPSTPIMLTYDIRCHPDGLTPYNKWSSPHAPVWEALTDGEISAMEELADVEFLTDMPELEEMMDDQGDQYICRCCGLPAPTGSSGKRAANPAPMSKSRMSWETVKTIVHHLSCLHCVLDIPQRAFEYLSVIVKLEA